MKKLLMILLAVCSVVSLAAVLYLHSRIPNTAYVEIGEVYNAFDLKKELEGNLKNVQQTREYILDSLELQLNTMASSIEEKNGKLSDEELKLFEARRNEYYMKEKAFTEDGENASQQYNDQIWKQLNQYVKEYGKEKGYTYIFGADGSGTLMYAADAANVTEEMIEFVNAKYKGGAK